jgi:hypothetical protein
MAEWTFTKTPPDNHFAVKGFNGGRDFGVMFRSGSVGFVVSEDDTTEEIADVLQKVVDTARQGKAGLIISAKAKKDQQAYREGI